MAFHLTAVWTEARIWNRPAYPLPRCWRHLASPLLAAVTISSAGATPLVVTPDGTGVYATIQAAVDAARDGDVIELGNGTYRGPGNRDVSWSDRSLTIRSRSGDPDSCVIDCEASESDPHRAFRIKGAENTTVTLEGVTIRGGMALGSGGAVLGTGVHARIQSCIFLENRARGDEDLDGRSGTGGAVALIDCGPITISNCTFERNLNDMHGGGLGLLRSRDISVRDCSFTANRGEGPHGRAGGAFRAEDCDTVRVERSRFQGNFCKWAGGALVVHIGTAIVRDCTFEDNHSAGRPEGAGGAIAVGECDLTVVRSVFRRNSCDWSSGAICGASRSSLTVQDCLFAENQTGAHAGAFSVYEYSEAVLTDCTFVENHGSWSIIGSMGDSFLTFDRCTIVRNGCENGIFASFDDVGSDEGRRRLTIHNSIIADNVGPAFGETNSETCRITCTNVFGNTGGNWDAYATEAYGVDGNISVDPRFCDPAGEQLFLASDSPCVGDADGGCAPMGAWPVGCRVPAPQVSWGQGAPDSRDAP